MGAGRFGLPLALLAVAGGILAADLRGAPPQVAVTGVAAVLTLRALLTGPRSPVGGGLLLATVVAAGSGAGAWRQAATDGARPGGLASVAALVDGDEHEIAGVVVDDPRPREDRVQLVLGELVAAVDGGAVALGDRLLVWMPRGLDARSGARSSWPRISTVSRTASTSRARRSAPSVGRARSRSSERRRGCGRLSARFARCCSMG